MGKENIQYIIAIKKKNNNNNALFYASANFIRGTKVITVGMIFRQCGIRRASFNEESSNSDRLRKILKNLMNSFKIIITD